MKNIIKLAFEPMYPGGPHNNHVMFARMTLAAIVAVTGMATAIVGWGITKLAQ